MKAILKTVVQTMIKIVIETTNDFEWFSFLEKWRHERSIAKEPCARKRNHVSEINQWKCMIEVIYTLYLLSLAVEQ